MTPPRDRIFVSQIACKAAIGVSADERRVPQPLSIDVEVRYDLRPAGRSDSIDDSLDYGEIVARVADLAGRGTYNLLETLAERIAAEVLDMGGERVRVLVRKLEPPVPAPVAFVSVEVQRDRPMKAN